MVSLVDDVNTDINNRETEPEERTTVRSMNRTTIMPPPAKTVKDWRREARALFQEGLESDDDDSDDREDTSTSLSRPATAQDFSSWNGVFCVKHAARQGGQPRRGTQWSKRSAEDIPNTGTPTSSSPGNHQIKKLDRRRLDFSQNKLYGRDEEVKRLLQVHQSSVSSSSVPKPPSVILIEGDAGVGKTCLASQLEPHVKSASGMYVHGTYDDPAHGMILPYQGIMAACQQICHVLEEIHNSSHRTVAQERLEQLRQALGSSVAVFAQLLPRLLELLGVQQSYGDEQDNMVWGNATSSGCRTFRDPRTRLNQLFFAMTTFLRTVASWGPLILVLENLQYIDGESLELLDFLTRDEALHNLVLVGCYRTI